MGFAPGEPMLPSSLVGVALRMHNPVVLSHLSLGSLALPHSLVVSGPNCDCDGDGDGEQVVFRPRKLEIRDHSANTDGVIYHGAYTGAYKIVLESGTNMRTQTKTCAHAHAHTHTHTQTNTHMTIHKSVQAHLQRNGWTYLVSR
jgi:hypothetical protein